MVTIDGTTITMTRGDTLKVTISLKSKDGTTYTPSANDVVKFTVKEKYTDKDALIEKTIPTNTMLLHLEPDDTKELKMPKKYVYDMELTKANGDRDTFIDKATLSITEEVG